MKGEWQHKSGAAGQTERGDRIGGWETDWQLLLAVPPAQLQGGKNIKQGEGTLTYKKNHPCACQIPPPFLNPKLPSH